MASVIQRVAVAWWAVRSRVDGTSGLFHPCPIRRMLVPMDGQSIAHDLPELYRAVLERVAQLERGGARREAAIIRSDAIAAYSVRWDEAAKRRMTALVARADRVLGGVDRARGTIAESWAQLFRRRAA